MGETKRYFGDVDKFRRGPRVETSWDLDVRMTSPNTRGELPLLIEPKLAGMELVPWAKAHRPQLMERLARHGALFFRGFGMDEVAKFEQMAHVMIDEVYKENGEHHPITPDGVVQIPVEYASDKQLLWHNENSFNHIWPRKIMFACAIPALQGGETPLVDSREMVRRLDPAIRRRFAEKGVMYVRYYRNYMGLSWQKVFNTTSRAVAEAKCRQDRFGYEWLNEDDLKTEGVRPAIIAHPVTGELCWFNQAQHWHFSCLDEATRLSLAEMFEERDYPRNCYFGDGSKIDDSIMAEILALYAELETATPWQKGDLVLVDNVATAHGRNAYKGPRKILVSMGEMTDYDSI